MPRYEDRPCADCGKVRRVQMVGRKPLSPRCHPCGARHRAKTRPSSWNSREGHPRWKGGRHITAGGYVQIVVPTDDPMLSMADARGRVYEHRLVMARGLGRCLDSSEEVHHRNGDKQDNRLENLELLSKSQHAREPFRRIAELEAEVARLRGLLGEAASS